MLNKTGILLGIALIVGSASTALAGEGSADLSYPPGYDLTHSAPQHSNRVFRGARGDARDAFGYVAPRTREFAPQRGISNREQLFLQHGNGGIDSE